MQPAARHHRGHHYGTHTGACCGCTTAGHHGDVMENGEKITFQDRLEKCPGCSYTGGFHIILLKHPAAHTSEMNFALKCPSCSRIYDLNLYCMCRQ